VIRDVNQEKKGERKERDTNNNPNPPPVEFKGSGREGFFVESKNLKNARTIITF